MSLDRYVYKADENFLDYEFHSIGPKGSIKKLVRFSQLGFNLFNLAFGDQKYNSKDINDTIITNNGDSRKVLATVAHIIHDFLLRYPGVMILAKGSTHSRTRLYRIGITVNWKEISTQFEIFGFKENVWEWFKGNQDYESFLIRRK